MFEARHEPIIPFILFLKRLCKFVLFALMIFCIALGIGILGYHHLEKLSWLEAFLNSALLLADMGPVTPVQTEPGKIFIAFYGMFSGLIFVSLIGMIFAPILHRFLHQFHSK